MARVPACTRVGPLLVAVTIAGGCQLLHLGGQPKPEPHVTAEAAVKAAALRDDLFHFSDRFAGGVSATADEIASRSGDREVLEMTLLWKLRQIPTMQDIIRTEDPRRGLLDAWALCVRMRDYLKEGDGKDVFKDQQQLAVDMAVKLEEDIVRIAGRFLSAPQLAEATKEVEAFADGVPLKGRFATDLIRASTESAGHGPGILSMLSIPIGGVTETADAIQHVARVMAVATEVIADIPERTRWQTELLLLETEKLDMVVNAQQDLASLTKSMESISETARTSAQEDLARLTKSIESISQTAETLPEDLRVQVEAVLESTNEVQEKLQANLKEARATIEDLDATIDKAGQTVTTVKEVMDGFNEAAVAWKATAESVDSLMVTIKEMGGTGDGAGAAPAPPAGDGKKFDIDDYTRAATQIREAAVQVQSLLGEVDTVSDSTAKLATTSADALIDRITIRAIVIVASILVAAILFLVAHRLLKAR